MEEGRVFVGAEKVRNVGIVLKKQIKHFACLGMHHCTEGIKNENATKEVS